MSATWNILWRTWDERSDDKVCLIRAQREPNKKSMTAATNQNNRPLTGRTVVVVEPDRLSAAFLRELEGNGARVLTCPPVEIGECENYDQLDEALEHLFGYDWLLFTTVPGAAAFLRRLHEIATPFNFGHVTFGSRWP